MMNIILGCCGEVLMFARIRIALFSSLLLIAGISCNLSNNLAGIIFEDDFSDPGTGWDIHTDINGSTDYNNGGYLISSNVDQYFLWSNPGLSFNDVIIEVDATKIGGGDDNQFGVICRYRDENNFYLLSISSDGFYSIRKRIGGANLEFINSDGWLDSPNILQGNSLNKIHVECVGSRLTLIANGIILMEVNDSDISFGDVGLFGGTVAAENTEILFDNFEVIEP